MNAILENVRPDTVTITEKPKIAFIDDEKRILRSMKLLFRKTHDVFTTTNPEEYIDFMVNNHVHVAVSDQRMPERLGVDILREVKEVSPTTMRILLTGYADLNAIIGSINDGEIYRYLTKPCKAEEIQSIVGKATKIAMLNLDSVDEELDFVASIDHKESLLVIDENEETISKIKAQFSNSYNIYRASTLEEAYDYLANHDIGVCLTDIHIEGENIAPVIYTLKQDAPNLVVLVQTQFQDASLLINLINKGQVYRCLPKPMRPSLLEVSINRAFRHHNKLKASPDLTLRHEVERDPNDMVDIDLSSRVKSFIGRLRKRFLN